MQACHRQVVWRFWECVALSAKRNHCDIFVNSLKAFSSAKNAEKNIDLEEQWVQMRARVDRARIKAVREANSSTSDFKDYRMRMRRLGLVSPNEDDNLLKQRYLSSKKNQRRAKSQKDKQFTNVRDAPDSVRHRDFVAPDEPKNSKALDIAVIGRPNAGKSSLVNCIVGSNISAVSKKYNTTRDCVLGILTEGDTQLAFHDTPGLIKPRESHLYIRSLVTTAVDTAQSVDASILVVDAVKRLDDGDLEAIEKVLESSACASAPTLLVINKMDLVGRKEYENFQKRINMLSKLIEDVYDKIYVEHKRPCRLFAPTQYIYENCLKISAAKAKGIDRLKQELFSHAMLRPWGFHSALKSDKSDLELVTEVIRSQLFERYNNELPYTMEQENVGWTKFADKSIRIDQDIFVSQSRHLRMIIGYNGDAIRAVGLRARLQIEKLLQTRVHLYLNVRAKTK